MPGTLGKTTLCKWALSAALVLCLCAAPAAAADDAPPVQPIETGATCDAALHDAGAREAPAELAPLGDAVQLSACSAMAECGTEGSVSCTGNSTCNAVDRGCSPWYQNGYVECDGHRTSCPSGCEDNCWNQYQACISQCLVFIPCVSDCRDAYDLCRCDC